MHALRTTRPIRPVTGIDDIRAIEALPYDQAVPARNLHDLLRATAQDDGDRLALTVLNSPDPGDIGLSLTHAGLLGAVTQAANLFHQLGLRAGQGEKDGVAAFLTPTLPLMPVLYLGAQIAGVTSTLNYLLNRDTLVDLLRAENARLLIVPAPDLDAMCWDKAQGLLRDVPGLDRILVIGATGPLPDGFTALEPLLEAQSPDALDFAPTQDRDTVCALFHTGGTTGRPKLVPLTHGNQIHAAFAFGQVFGYDRSDTVLNGFPFFHVGGTMTVGLSVLASGGHMVVPSPYALRPPQVITGYWHLAEALGATIVSGVPTSLAAMAAAWTPGRDLSRIRMAVTGGAVLPAAVGDRFRQVTSIPIHETYGMTETSAAIAFTPGAAPPVPGSVGLRPPYSETRILRITDTTPCAPGESGLVQVRGPQVFPGYADPRDSEGVLDADGWLSTGDVGYLTDDERLVLTGREKDLIVRSGHNIDPAAIEDVANALPGVEISAAVGMPDQYAGEVPVLFVVPRDGQAFDLAALHQQLEDGLHEPPARPRRILQIDALPVTAVGKIFKPALRDLAIAEKLRLEVAEHCGPRASVDVRVTQDAQKRLCVQALVADADAAGLAALAQALAPLPQSYAILPACVDLTTDGPIATLTLNRPAQLNAASQALMWSLDHRLTQLMTRDDLRAVILTGAGRAFCAGGDLREFDAARAESGSRLADTLAYNQQVISRIAELPMPVIGAVNGTAVAGGLEMLLACDIVLAADSARIGDGHARYGIVPTGGATARLPDRIGPMRAAHLFLTADLIDAATARDWGLVTEVLPDAALMPRARTLAQEIAARSPETLRALRRLTAPDARARPLDDRLRAERDAFDIHLQGRDLAEGLRAFNEKRAPNWDAPRTDR
ncbi:MAG: enoyl-CoA hydratase-related protein [Pseudomonadota bacterium]|nr:enoyl-CoA hydratase-related protein [Pseudomonadota bacterium]